MRAPLVGTLPQDQQVRRQRDRLADNLGADAFGQRGGGRIGRTLGRAVVDRAAERFDGRIAGIAIAELLAGQLVLVEQLGHHRAESAAPAVSFR